MKSIVSLVAVAAGLLDLSYAAADPYPAAALEYRQFKALTKEGCYSSNGGMTLNNDTFIYNTQGWCQQQCVPLGKAVLAVSNSKECWCGDSMPAATTKVDDSKCNTPCAGYGDDMCGGAGFYTIYLTGLTASVPGAEADTSSTTTPAAGSTASPTVSAKPSVVTIGGQTVVVTAAPQSTSSGTSSNKKSGPNVAAIAAGVVVGLVGMAAIAGGVYLFMRNKRRREIEEEHRRTAAVNSFVGSGKAPTSGSSSFTDTRLDPAVMANRRISDVSIADNQDYSRRILKVTNA